jgi:uncharacterized protein YraI
MSHLPAHSDRFHWLLGACALALLVACGCSAAAPTESIEITGADDSIGETADNLSGSLPVGSVLRTTTGVNFRKGPSTGYSVIRVLAAGTQVKTVVRTTSSNGFWQVEHAGTQGWCHGAYLAVVQNGGGGSGGSAGSGGGGGGGNTSKRDAAITRAKSGEGFSYWWGHARWLPSGPTSSTRGSCSGSCPSCSHSGQYGADCSGYVGKIWQVPAGNDDLTVDSHPYSTATFVSSSSQWSTVSRDSLLRADALVYNTGGSGHIMLYSSGDGWGQTWAYECKGCSAGCVYNLRSVGSTYKGIRRAGY